MRPGTGILLGKLGLGLALALSGSRFLKFGPRPGEWPPPCA